MASKQNPWVDEGGGEEPAMHATEAEQTRERRAGRFVLKSLLLLAGLFLLFMVGLSLFSSVSLEGMQAFREKLERMESVMWMVRLLAILGLIGFWRPLNAWLARRNGWSSAHLQRVLDGRWSTLGVLLFVELILIQRLHEPLIDRMVN